MSAITLVNNASSAVDFRLFQGINRIADVGVRAGESANVPTTTKPSQIWMCYALCNGTTSAEIAIDDPNATVTATADNDDSGIILTIT
jgi:hypothetical protein